MKCDWDKDGPRGDVSGGEAGPRVADGGKASSTDIIYEFIEWAPVPVAARSKS